MRRDGGQVGMAVLLLLACLATPSAQSATEPANSNPVTSTVITAVGDRNYPPYLFLDKGKPAGFDHDLLQAVRIRTGESDDEAL